MPISDKLIDQLLEGCSSPEEILGESGLLEQLTKKVAERALEAEIESHLGYAKHEPAGKNTGNSRNGKGRKSVRSVHGEIDLVVPRDRNSTFEPKLIKKGEKQLYGFDDRIISLCARGMTTRDIQAHFEDAYGVEVSATFISQVTNAVIEEVTAWQNRPLATLYPVVYLDALVVRSRASGTCTK
jgi:transposase-like protein